MPAVSWLTDPFAGPAGVRALLELGLLAVLAGVLGSWVVLRRLSFFTHAAGTATFPGLVVAGPWGIPAQLGAFAAALAFAGGLGALARRPRLDAGTATGILLVAALAGGVVLASDVYGSGAAVDTLLVGSLVSVGTRDVLVTGAVVLAAVVAEQALRRRWAAATFDPDAARALGVASRAAETALPVLVALAAVVAVDAVGALLAGVVLVVPAATARLITDDLDELRRAAVALALLEGVGALWLAGTLDVGAGPALALLGGAVFAAVALATAARRPVAA
jgi:manganese/iron transport system permease protein